MDENEIIQTYFAPLAAGAAGAFALTDDAATITPPPECELVITTDALVSGIHFLPEDPPADIAVKALAVNLSDLAGKGAHPLAYTLSLCLPRPVSSEWLAGFRDGLAAMQDTHGIRLIGGDTTRSPAAIMVSITAFGTVPTGTMVRRATARPGDQLYVTGTIGDAALGLLIASGDARTNRWGLDDDARSFLLSRYRRPQPRTNLAPVVRRFSSAGMDISDGLVIDATRLCRASGVSATIQSDLVPLSAPARTCLAADPDCLETLLTGGDDYELLMTVKPEEADALSRASAGAGTAIQRIGEVSDAGQPGVEVIGPTGAALSFSHPGYTHFS